MIGKNVFLPYHELSKGVSQNVDRGLNSWQYWCLIVLYSALSISGISRIVAHVIKRKIGTQKATHEGIISVVLSKNNRIVDTKIKELTELLFPTYDFTGDIRNSPHTFSNKIVLWATIANANTTFSELWAARRDRVLFNNSIRVIKLSGLDYIFNLLLDDSVRVLIKYNDHSPYSIFLYDLANTRGIKTVYIQHAPVGERFPPLYHTLNVLFSEDSLYKYKKKNKEIKTFMFFDVRFPLIAPPLPEPGTKQAILICPNILDDIIVVNELAKRLSLNYNIIIRPHPADKRAWNNRFDLSQNRSIWEDLAKVKYVLTNESAVILEGLYANRLCYKCAFFSESRDSYGFIRHGLITKDFFSMEELELSLKNNFDCCDASKLSFFIGDIKNRNENVRRLKEEIYALINKVHK